MDIEEHGMAEGLARLEAELQRRAAATPAAWSAAAITDQSDLVDAVAAMAPRASGELAGSGFVNRETGEAGFGSNHAWRIQGEFDAAVAERAPETAARMGERLEQYIEDGITPSTAPSNWPETPATGGGGRSRHGGVRRVRAGAPRSRIR